MSSKNPINTAEKSETTDQPTNGCQDLALDIQKMVKKEAKKLLKRRRNDDWWIGNYLVFKKILPTFFLLLF